ncbi:unnamed protein product [Ceutorhynchus assimilis]|uniref:Transforming acidic coiled-coil-containing protein C-terminal domain-containing protein n=1 Tax=Ceutorhynchus assimilis TaxID=467358 RepID=A0A9N9MNG3_9CUCU|nr:unnamed protein product [Ceutorhynchus assimilis]
MFSADNKENNAKSSTDDKSTNKTVVRRSVLKEFDPFYSSPHQNLDKPTAINEECEEEANDTPDDTQINKKLEDPLLQANASKQDFQVTPKTSQGLAEYLSEHKTENLSKEEYQHLKEAYILENDYCAYIKYTPDKKPILECVRDLTDELAMLNITESVPENQLPQYFECQEPKPNDIVFVNTHFDCTFDQTQNMEACDPLGGSFVNKTVDHLDQESVYEECLDTSFSNVDSAEPENEEILEIINRSFEEALDGNDVEIEDNNSQDGIFENVVQSFKKEDTEEKDTSVINKSIGANMETSHKIQQEDDSFAVVNLEEIEINPDQDCEGTAGKSIDRVVFENQQGNVSFGTELKSAQDVEEANAKSMDVSFEAKETHKETVDTTFKAQDTTFEEVCDAQHQHASFVIEEVYGISKVVISEADEAKSPAQVVVSEDQPKNTSFVIEENEKIPEIIITEATEVEDAQIVNEKLMDTTFEGKNEAAETTHEEQPKEVILEAEIVHDAIFVTEETSSKVAQNVNDKPMNTTFEGKNEAAEDQLEDRFFVDSLQSPNEVICKAEIVHEDQHENATFMTEETDSKDIISEATELDLAHNVSDKPMDTTFGGKNEAAETTHEPKDASFSVKSAVLSPEEIFSEADQAETVHEDANFVTEETSSKDIISEATEVEVAQNVTDKLMDATFEGKNEAVKIPHEDHQPKDVSVVFEDAVLSPDEIIFEAENATFVADECSSKDVIAEATEEEVQKLTPINTTFEEKNEVAEDQHRPKNVSVESPEEVIFEAEIVHDDQHGNATFVTEETSPKDIISEVELVQNVTDKPVNTTFEGKNEVAEDQHRPKDVSVESPEEVIFEAEIVHDDQHGNATFVTEETCSKDIISKVELAQNVTDKPVNTTFGTLPEDASFVLEAARLKETDDEPMDITIKTKTISSPEIATYEETDEPMETSIIIVDTVEVNSTETHDERMDISSETNEAQKTIIKPTFEAETEDNISNPRASIKINTSSSSFVISDEHAAESTKCAEALAQSLNQTIDVEESAIIEDIDAIDNLNVTLEAAQNQPTGEVQLQVENQIVQKEAEIVEVEAVIIEDAKSDNAEVAAEIHEDSNKLVSEPIQLSPKPKRLECRPSIRPLCNKTQVIVNPLILQQPESRVSDGNLVFELNLLQTELKRIQEDNAKKDQSILAHVMNSQSAKETVRKYEHITREYNNHVKKQSEDLKLMRRRSDQVAANLISTEMAFSAVFKNYEKAKSAIESYKKNESILCEEINKLEDKSAEVNLECKLVEEKCLEEIKTVQEQADRKKEAYQQNLNKLQANVKRLKIKASSLECSLKQKTEECQALATLCDDILKEKPSTVS